MLSPENKSLIPLDRRRGSNEPDRPFQEQRLAARAARLAPADAERRRHNIEAGFRSRQKGVAEPKLRVAFPLPQAAVVQAPRVAMPDFVPAPEPAPGRFTGGVIAAVTAMITSVGVLTALLVRSMGSVQPNRPAPAEALAPPALLRRTESHEGVRESIAPAPRPPAGVLSEQARFRRSYERLGAALRAFPGVPPEQVLRAAEARSTAKGCSLSWRNGEAAIQFGGEGIARGLENCAEAVEKLREQRAK